jgi:hypothetical protein
MIEKVVDHKILKILVYKTKITVFWQLDSKIPKNIFLIENLLISDLFCNFVTFICLNNLFLLNIFKFRKKTFILKKFLLSMYYLIFQDYYLIRYFKFYLIIYFCK